MKRRKYKVESIHREIAGLLIETFKPRMDVIAERFDDAEQVASMNAFLKAKNIGHPYRIGDWKPAGKKGARDPVTLDAVADHVAGNRTLGFYMSQRDNTCNSVSIDLDNHHGAKETARDPREDFDLLAGVLLRRGVRFLANHSRGGRGYWLHVLPPVGTGAREARAFVNALVRESGVRSVRDGGTFDCIFPKQDAAVVRGDDPTASPGNLFCLPVSARWMAAPTPGTHFLGTNPGDVAAQLAHLKEF